MLGEITAPTMSGTLDSIEIELSPPGQWLKSYINPKIISFKLGHYPKLVQPLPAAQSGCP